MKYPVFFVSMLIAIFLASCSGIFPTPTPTPSPTPLPTATPTVTPPPTATRPPPTATKENALPPALAFALNKTQSVNSMKFEFESVVTTLQNGKTQTIPGLAIAGVDSTLNRAVTISGTTSDTNELVTYEVVVVGADVFIKGLNGSGLELTQWYILPEAMQAGVRRFPTARGLIASFNPEEVGKAQFKAGGTETVDDLACSIWTAQNPKFAQTLVGVTDDSDLKKQVGEIDAAEFKVWTCADGYIHQMQGNVQGHSAQNKENKATVTLRFQMSNFNDAVKINAPTDAIAFPSALQATPTTNPAATKPAASPTETKSASPSPTP